MRALVLIGAFSFFGFLHDFFLHPFGLGSHRAVIEANDTAACATTR